MPVHDIDKACRLHEQAVAAHSQGKYKEAEALGVQALELIERVQGADHPNAANILNHLAAGHASLGDYRQAERLGRRALRIMERLNGMETAILSGSGSSR